MSPCRHSSTGTLHQSTTNHRCNLQGVTSSARLPGGSWHVTNNTWQEAWQHNVGLIHTAVLVAAHVAIRHLTTANGIRSTAATHGSTSQQEHRHGHNGSTRHHHIGRTSEHGHVSRTFRHEPTETKNAPGSRSDFHPGSVPPYPEQTTYGRTHGHTVSGTTSNRPPRHDTPTFHAHHGHNGSGRGHTYTTAQKKPLTAFFRRGLFLYSVTSFTISSAVFPSLAFRNFALASPRFTSGMCFSASLSNLASPGVNLFNRSKIAKP